MPHLKLLPDAKGKMHQVMVPSRRTGGKGRGKKHRFRHRVGFLSRSTWRLAIVVMIAEALAVTVLAGLPKIISPQALILWLYAAWKKNKQAFAIATVYQVARIASVMGVTAGVASATSNIKLAGFSAGSSTGGIPGLGGLNAGQVGSGLGGLLAGLGTGGGAAGGQSSDQNGNPVPASTTDPTQGIDFSQTGTGAAGFDSNGNPITA